MASFTLQHMAAGGIFDHVGGGFHRYRLVMAMACCGLAALEALLAIDVVTSHIQSFNLGV